MASATRLYRSLLKTGSQYRDYNLREYAQRRIKLGFQQGRALEGESASAALAEGSASLQALHRQVVVSNMYCGSPSVMLNVENRKA